MSGKIEYNIVKDWLITQPGTVGPSKDIALRPASTLLRPESYAGLKDDAQTIYVDPILGSDLNNGFTLATAKRYISEAYAITTYPAGRWVIHIDTLSAVTDFEVALAYLEVNTKPLKVQVAPGLNYTLIVHAPFLFVNTGTALPVQRNQLNGLTLRVDEPIDTLYYPIFAGHFAPIGIEADSFVELLWCDWEVFYVNMLDNISRIALFNTITRRRIAFSQTYNPWNFTIPYLHGAYMSLFISDDSESGWFLNFWGANITNNTFIGGKYVWHLYYYLNGGHGYSYPADPPSLIANNIFDNIYSLASPDSELSWDSPVTAISVPITNSLINVQVNSPQFDITSVTNVLQRSALFRKVGEDYRLQHKALVSPISGLNYPFNSPAIGIGNTGGDAGCYDVSYTFNGETVETFDLSPDGCIETAYENVKYIPKRKNYKEWDNVIGYANNTFDTVKARIEINFPDNYWVGSNYTQKFKQLLSSKGNKRFYPCNGSIYVLQIAYNNVTSAYQLDLDPLTIPSNLIDDWLIGWVAKCEWDKGGTGTTYILITACESQPANYFIGTKLRGDDMPINVTSGLVTVEYWPCLLSMESAEFNSENYVAGYHVPWYKDSADDQSDEFHVRNIILDEATETLDA